MYYYKRMQVLANLKLSFGIGSNSLKQLEIGPFALYLFFLQKCALSNVETQLANNL